MPYFNGLFLSGAISFFIFNGSVIFNLICNPLFLVMQLMIGYERTNLPSINRKLLLSSYEDSQLE